MTNKQSFLIGLASFLVTATVMMGGQWLGGLII